MVIDAHAHFGSILDFYMPEKMLIQSMDKYGIDCAVVSNIQGIEFDHDKHPLTKDRLQNQIDINYAAIEFSRKFPGRIFPLVWVMPHTGGVSEEFCRFVLENRSGIYGLKLHPYLNQAPVDSELVEPYVRLAAEYDLPVVVHTASTDESSPRRVYNIAVKYPCVKFVMVHLGMYTDHEESINLIAKQPNLYGDTTWVAPESILKLFERAGPDRVMFGSDAPISGPDGYSNPIYQTYLEKWKTLFNIHDYEKLMSGNAVKFFGLPV